MKLYLNVFREDVWMLQKFGSVARMYLMRWKISNSLIRDKDFCHDWLTEFYWKSLDADHPLADGLIGVLKRYDFLKRERGTIGGQAGEALSDKSREA
jgi:hypothetical protein